MLAVKRDVRTGTRSLPNHYIVFVIAAAICVAIASLQRYSELGSTRYSSATNSFTHSSHSPHDAVRDDPMVCARAVRQLASHTGDRVTTAPHPHVCQLLRSDAAWKQLVGICTRYGLAAEGSFVTAPSLIWHDYRVRAFESLAISRNASSSWPTENITVPWRIVFPDGASLAAHHLMLTPAYLLMSEAHVLLDARFVCRVAATAILIDMERAPSSSIADAQRRQHAALRAQLAVSLADADMHVLAVALQERPATAEAEPGPGGNSFHRSTFWMAAFNAATRYSSGDVAARSPKPRPVTPRWCETSLPPSTARNAHGADDSSSSKDDASYDNEDVEYSTKEADREEYVPISSPASAPPSRSLFASFVGLVHHYSSVSAPQQLSLMTTDGELVCGRQWVSSEALRRGVPHFLAALTSLAPPVLRLHDRSRMLASLPSVGACKRRFLCWLCKLKMLRAFHAKLMYC